MSTFRSLYAGPDDRVNNMKFRVLVLYFLSSVFVCVSMLVPSGLFVVRVGIWACLVLMSLFATFSVDVSVCYVSLSIFVGRRPKIRSGDNDEAKNNSGEGRQGQENQDNQRITYGYHRRNAPATSNAGHPGFSFNAL